MGVAKPICHSVQGRNTENFQTGGRGALYRTEPMMKINGDADQGESIL